MPSYIWTQDRTNNYYTLGNPPLWWTTSGDPVMAAVVPSPVGAGDTLVRTEIWASAGVFLEGYTSGHEEPSNAFGVVMKLQGEVYVAGDTTIPNPDDLGVSRAVITAAMGATSLAYDSTTEPGRGGMTWSTLGIVTSKGERGPAQYGSGHPELHVGLIGENVFDPGMPGSFNSTWNVWVRCLWRTP